MFCPRCGEEAETNTFVCANCGAKLPPAYVGPRGDAETSPKAVASRVLGLIGIVCLPLCTIPSIFLGLPAVVLGVMAKNEIRNSQGQVIGSGLAIAGIILGTISFLLGCLIIGVFALFMVLANV